MTQSAQPKHFPSYRKGLAEFRFSMVKQLAASDLVNLRSWICILYSAFYTNQLLDCKSAQLNNQHRISVTVKSVFVFNRFLVGSLN